RRRHASTLLTLTASCARRPRQNTSTVTRSLKRPGSTALSNESSLADILSGLAQLHMREDYLRAPVQDGRRGLRNCKGSFPSGHIRSSTEIALKGDPRTPRTESARQINREARPG